MYFLHRVRRAHPYICPPRPAGARIAFRIAGHKVVPVLGGCGALGESPAPAGRVASIGTVTVKTRAEPGQRYGGIDSMPLCGIITCRR